MFPAIHFEFLLYYYATYYYATYDLEYLLSHMMSICANTSTWRDSSVVSDDLHKYFSRILKLYRHYYYYYKQTVKRRALHNVLGRHN